MLRDEAEKLIGKRVSAWTAMNGEYTGILLAVSGRPWRGTVEIDGVLKPAVAYDRMRTGKQRCGIRPGDVIAVGGANIKPHEEQGGSYAEALLAERQAFEATKKAAKSGDHWWIDRSIEEIDKRLEEEGGT